MTVSDVALKERPFLSVVLPAYNEEENLRPMHERLLPVLERCSSGFEIILVDDGSSDGSLRVMQELRSADDRVKVVSFTRNFGHESATSAGLEFSSGEAVVIIDADLQDPPEVIEEMVERWREGYEVVYGQRRRREKEPVAKKASSYLFYRLLNRVAEMEVPVDTGDFRLMDRGTVDNFLALRERNRFIRMEVAWLGGRSIGVLYDREARLAGKTKYDFSRRLRLAVDGILSFSTLPLRVMSVTGMVIFWLSMVGILVVLIQRMFFNIQVPGYAFLVISLFALNGMQILFLGLLGEYLARVYKEVQDRPLYLVKAALGFENGKDGKDPLP